MITEMKAANALGAKTARACDSCLRRRARWFCAADDAFLCHGCDNLVHSANQLASRHERVRLQTASSKVKYCSVTSNKATPQAWHSGFTRKARTPRHNKHLLAQQRSKDEETLLNSSPSTLPVVPELEGEEAMVDESDEQLLCRVPVLDPFEADLCSMYSEVGDERLDSIMKKDISGADDLDNFSEFLSSDMDLAEFAADVESLLESGFDEDSGEMKGAAELFDCKEEDERDAYVGVKTAAMVKIKDEQVESASAGNVETKGKIFLRLNYEEVISAWASQGCPWTSGHPPQFNSDECWLDCLGSSGADVRCSYVRSLRGQLLGSEDGGREARVSRYREKRRTRLFAKKIRYEVRKLNAEKRPRMKGRFVKRSSFLGTPSR